MRDIKKLAIVSNVQLSGEKGGAEVFYEKLLDSFKKVVPHVDLIEVPCSEATFEEILKGYLDCYDLDLSEYDGVISSKVPTYGVRHSNHVCYLMHTVRVFYDMFNEIKHDSSNLEKRKLIFKLDKEMLCSPNTKKLYTIGTEVGKRLKKYTGLDSEVLYPGITSEGFFCEEFEYVFLPGRLHKWKRTDLLIRAMQYVKSPVKLLIAGTGEAKADMEKLAANDKRIEFLGFVSDEELKKLYANALVVPFTPIREDYGYVLHEAFKSKKPIITCTDSGEPTQFIKQGVNGFLAKPDPKEIAQYIDYLYNNNEKAREMGQCGFNSIKEITWDNVVKELLKALED